MSDELAKNGFWVCENIFDADECQVLKAYFNENIPDFRLAHIGRGPLKTENPEIRSDSIMWVNLETESLMTYRNVISQITEKLKRELYLPIRKTETQMALYEKGDSYSRHRDQLKNSNKRLVTSVYYLNQDWCEGDGGELLIYKGNHTEKVNPLMNQMVLFLSELEHEVLVTNKNRKSITTWFREDI